MDSSQHTETTQNETSKQGVSFDVERSCLVGIYNDEISAHRAKKAWIEILESHFLLVVDTDHKIAINSEIIEDRYVVTCAFITACARYTFWRLTNSQAPEAQYVIETAHIPLCESRHLDILQAPDLQPLDEPAILSGIVKENPHEKESFLDRLLNLLK